MCHYTHLTPFEREKILFFLAEGKSITEIAHLLKRSKSTISRELRRNVVPVDHCPLTAQALYKQRREACHPHKRLEHASLHSYIQICKKELKRVTFYFPAPHHPWERGTNENTNGLLREFFPKGKDITDMPEDYIQRKYHELNLRPRKYLGYKTLYEVYFSKVLHLA